MKKALCLAFLAALALVFASACGRDDTDSNDATTAPPATEAATAPPATEPADTSDNGETAVDPQAPDFNDDLYAFLDWHFPATDLGGITLRVNGFGDRNHYNPVYAARDTERFARVEQRFNVIIEDVPDLVALAGEWADVPALIQASVAAGDPVVHIMRGNMSYWFPTLANQGYLVDISDAVRNRVPPAYWDYFGLDNQGRPLAFNYGPAYPWNMLVYNRDLIRSVGMDYTPSEMFTQGRWSLDDMHEYLIELNSRLPEGVWPFGVNNQWWWRFTSFANGAYVVNPTTGLPDFHNPLGFEGLEMLQRWTRDGLHVAPGFQSNEEGSPIPGGHFTWGASFIGGPMIDQFRDGQIAISQAATWEFHWLGNYLEWGVVPPPWGSNVTFPASGDWRDLKTDTPYQSLFNDAGGIFMIRGTPEIVTGDVLINLAFTNWENRAEGFARFAEDHAAGRPMRMNQSVYMFTALDVEIFEWYATGSTFERMDATAGFWDLSVNDAILNGVGDPGRSIRASFEAIEPAMIWRMYQNPTNPVTRADITPAAWARIEELGLHLPPEDGDDD